MSSVHEFVISSNFQCFLATGTPEPGGWTSRELLEILRSLEGLEVVGADVVEVAPVYDTVGEITTFAAASIVNTLIELMVAKPISSSNGQHDV